MNIIIIKKKYRAKAENTRFLSHITSVGTNDKLHIKIKIKKNYRDKFGI